jgi:MFS superfamily sulfate permease-like transporter
MSFLLVFSGILIGVIIGVCVMAALSMARDND